MLPNRTIKLSTHLCTEGEREKFGPL